MRRVNLNPKLVQSLKPMHENYLVYDLVVPNLCVLVTATGSKSWVLYTRYPGTPSGGATKSSLGKVSKLTLKEARAKARLWLEEIASGSDPRERAKKAKRLEEERRRVTFKLVAEEFHKRHLKDSRSKDAAWRMIERELLPIWGKKPVSEIARRDVIDLIESVTERPASNIRRSGGLYSAHNLFGLIRVLFSWALDRDYGLTVSPCDRVKPVRLLGSRKPRQRVLNDDEIRALWTTTANLPPIWTAVFRILLLTGQRRAEVVGMRWRELDLERKLWIVPPERFKSDVEHRIPLSDDVVSILAALPRHPHGDAVFSIDGSKPVTSIAIMKDRLDAFMRADLGELPPFVTHDIRRTVRTGLSALRVQETVAELVIGHARRGLGRVYDLHRFEDEMRSALDAWAARVRGIVSPPAHNIIPIAGRRAVPMAPGDM